MVTIPAADDKKSMPLISAKESTLSDNLKKHVEKLAGEIGERNIWCYAALQQAATYIENEFRKLTGNVSLQEYLVNKRPVHNIEVEFCGTNNPDEIVIIGAHYDSVYGSPGANDNGTGTAAVLELANLLEYKELNRTVRFVTFVNEEPPFFMTRNMGSYRYVKELIKRNEKIIAMISIETIGYYSDRAKSQKYPFPYMFFYPNTANFIALVSNLASRKLLSFCVDSFRKNIDFPFEAAAAPSWIPGVSWSDQYSFWRKGYPAIMITDTALYRYPYYHSEEDTPEKIDYARTAKVVMGLHYLIADLAKSS